MTEVSNFDAIIIGAGQAGGPLAGALAKAGRKVALIEREHVGGTCINEGCTPTKTMIASARVAHLARRAADYGVNTGPVSVKLSRVRERKRAIVDSFRNGSQNSLEKIPGLDLIFGEASFIGLHSLEVRLRDGGTRQLNAPQVFINVGTRPFVPELPGLNEIPALNSTSIMELEVVPEHLIVLGGGYIGFEFGQMFARFGSRVSIIERGQRMLEREDPDVSQAITQVMTDEGMSMHPGCTTQSVHQTQDGRIELEINGPNGPKTITGSHLLVTIGRTSNADTLNLMAAGIQVDARGFIPVNEHLETGVEGIYALGDVKGGPAFTHISYDDYRIVRDRLLHGATRSTANRLVPYTMFTDPPLARIGLDETQARASGHDVLVFRLPMTRVARAIETDETRGLIKAVVDAQTGLLLGATVLGIEGGEVMSVLQMAIIGGVTHDRIREAVFAHPTLSESLNNLFMTAPERIGPCPRPDQNR